MYYCFGFMGGMVPSSVAKVVVGALEPLSTFFKYTPSFWFCEEELTSSVSVVQDIIIKPRAINVAKLNLFFIFLELNIGHGHGCSDFEFE